MKKVFIDGSAGTTGLRIRERLAARTDLEVLVLAEDVRKDPAARRDALNAAVVAFLCLPDAAAVEAVQMVENPQTVVIDTSTAHRTAAGWTYGFPELDGQRARIRRATRVANPGCHASGFIALVAPLVRAGVLPSDARLAGGGKKMIAAYEAEACAGPLAGGRQYALGQSHKHLPEMAKVCGLDHAPCFSPIVVPHYSGMEVTVPLFASQLRGVAAGDALAALREIYRAAYAEEGLVRFVEDPSADEGGFLSSAALPGRADMEVSIFGNAERLLLVARFDNLGKGASGAAIQNMNLVLGCAEGEGLVF